jgi:hypothetical protein
MKGLIDEFKYWNWKDKERSKLRKKMLSVQTGTLFGHWVISRAVDLGFRSALYGWKLRHRPKTFMGVQDLKRPFPSLNCSNNEEVRICPTAQTLFSVQPISRVLEVQMTSIFFLERWDNFLELSCGQSIQILTLEMTFCSDKKIRIVTKSRCGHPLNN